ncbi:MAG: hypothetical protein R3B70_27005 [Polyangiaceae bacterium]
MKSVLRLLALSLTFSAMACATLPPEEGQEDADLAEAESAVGEACSSLCECPLGLFCYIPSGQQSGTCIEDLFGPSDPTVCWADCQCPTGMLCDPTMHCAVPECASDCDCPAGDLCFQGQCIDDIYNPWSQCSADCHCSVGQTCNNGTCVGGGFEEP